MHRHIARLGLLLQVAVVVLALGATAMAGEIAIGGPATSGSDWSQEFNTSNGGVAFTEMQFFMETPNVDFTGPATWDSNPPSGWTSTQVNPQYVLMTGPSVGDFNFFLGFSSLQSAPFTFDFDVWNGTTFESYPQSGSATWNGSAWSFADVVKQPSEENTTTPEPVSMILMGTFLSLAGLLLGRKRLLA